MGGLFLQLIATLQYSWAGYAGRLLANPTNANAAKKMVTVHNKEQTTTTNSTNDTNHLSADA